MFNTTRMGLRRSLLAWILVFLQFLFIGLVFISSPVTQLKWWVIVFIFLGIALGLWAIQTIRLGNFNISPLLKPGGIMIAHGPYHFVRHPMYTAILLVCWPLVIGHFSWLRLAMVLCLSLILVVKLHLEENYLKKAFSAYREYTRTSKKLIPFVW
ncbi:MAG: methyltransferase [Lentimicrobium sp.]|jgi:protein-S-isoprenylcysteine O-methyltransferase Ste14|nr:methyltransferase [Lentimicrobium sp.]